MPRAALRGKQDQVIESIRRLVVRSVASFAKPMAAPTSREDVVAELILMVNPLYLIMSVAMLNYEWCLAQRSDLGTSGVWPK
jgi:hypothetical protein